MTLGRKDLLLLVIGLDAEESGIGGVTRLMKYLFLLGREEDVVTVDDFEFRAYKYGPYTPRLYEDLEFLENLGLIRSTNTGPATDAETDEAIAVDRLMGEVDEDTDEPLLSGDPGEERRYSLTPEGLQKMHELLARNEIAPSVKAIRKVKDRFARHSLQDLLHYVYTKHPDMTSESEIVDQVMRRRP